VAQHRAAESSSHEDKEFESAKRFVCFGSEAVKNATTTPAGDPIVAARAAAANAARKYAPGLPPGDSAKGRKGFAPNQYRHPPNTNGAVSSIHVQPAEETRHDIDRTQLEADLEMEGYELGEFGVRANGMAGRNRKCVQGS
jgi:hypothetical protein